MRHLSSAVRSAVLALALLWLGDLPLSAQTPQLFHACYVPLTGSVYRIKTADTRTACSSTSHIEFSWTDGANALRSGDAAGGDLSGTYPDPSVVGLRGTALSSTAPTSGQVLTFDGTSWTPAAPPAGGGGTSDHGALGGLTDDDHPQYLLTNGARNATNGFAVTGAFGTGSIPASGAGVRLMWYPGKAAFRSGEVTGTQWDDANIGGRSVAMGANTTASGDFSTAMGNTATASGERSTAMGFITSASGHTSTAIGSGTTASGVVSTAMGGGTTASGFFSTAMGNQTTASGSASTAMGSGTTASAPASTAMGDRTTASGQGSTAMGRFASTNGQAGSFVYGDASTATAVVNATGPNQFLVRAAGGTTFFSNPGLTGGVTLAPGAGAWTTVSDVSRKHLFRDEDGEAVLEKIARLPIRSWSYLSQDAGIRHLGPTAQDFHAAFSLGESELGITTTDIDGVNLLAVQALEKRTTEQARQNEAQAREIAELRTETAELRSRLAELAELRAELADLRAQLERRRRER